MKTLKNPPILPTELHPDDIIGQSMRYAFVEHFRKTFRCMTCDEFERMLKGTPDTTRKAIAIIHTKLRNNGYIPLRIDQTGDIVWGIITTSEFHAKNDFVPSEKPFE